MNRSLKLSMLLALALGSSQAAALDLGQIQVKSALGQPLLAEIPLTPDSPAELRNLSARLASPEDFARAGLSGARPDIPLQFSIADVGGRKVIRITSAVAINDPYLDLLVEVDNASGRSLREFPILLDPPGTQATPSVQAPRSTSRAASRSSAVPAPATSAAAQPAASQAAAGGQYGPVERGQTLSGIARKLAPAGVDPSQMMVALKQANPDAFYQDNINALKSGAVLRVPTSQEAQAMNMAAAMAEIRRQNSDWRAGAARSTTTVADAATRAQTSSAPGGRPAADRLALVPAKEGGKGAGAQGGSGKGDAALRQDLLRSQESLTTLQQQSAELKSRLKDLQDINDKNTRLLALKDNEIAELQQKLADARKKAGLPAAASSAGTAAPAATSSAPVAAVPPVHSAAGPAKPASVGSAASVAGAASATAAHGVATAGTVASPAVVPASKPVAKPRPAPAPAPAEEPWYMQPWAWAAAGGAVLVLILLALLGRRRKPAAPGRAASAAPSLADRFGSMPVEPSGSADPDQDELLDQLAEHPDDIGLHLELVSLYYSRRDVEHFEAAAEAMHAHIVDPQQDEWQDVLAMGEDLVPGHPLFAGAGYAAAESEDTRHHAEEALHPFDLDTYAADEETTGTSSAHEPASARPKVSEYHFDFNLTPPRSNPPSASEAMDAHVADEATDHTVIRHPESVLEDEAERSSWAFEEPAGEAVGADAGHATAAHEAPGFSDDPIDTKLDLARAYMDMGDADGARAMLEEVMNEGSQMQRDAAQRLLDSLA